MINPTIIGNNIKMKFKLKLARKYVLYPITDTRGGIVVLFNLSGREKLLQPFEGHKLIKQ